MSGYVDGVGIVVRFEVVGDNWLLAVAVLYELVKYIVCKGSVVVNGVSLMVNVVDGAGFEVNLVPYTL